MAETCRITVTRRTPDDERERQLYVSLDGERLGTLMFGRELGRDCDPGAHRLRVHNTLCWRTLDFEIGPGEHLTFTTANLIPTLFVGIAAALGAAPMFVRLEPVPDHADAASSNA
ncbi:MAG: hypothetical protein AB7I50_06330 [Vicinamibacterales bacterium]